MKPIRFFLFSVAIISFSYQLSAQLFTKPNPALNDALQKVINDIPNHLQNLQGSLLQKNAQSSTYESKIKIPGSVTTTVTAYTSKKDKSKSMEAVIFETENFAEAKKKYNELINQLKTGSLKLPGETISFKWKLSYDKPNENKNFSSSIFRTGSPADQYKNLKLEVAMNAQVSSYTVTLFLYEKKEDEQVIPENVSLTDYRKP